MPKDSSHFRNVAAGVIGQHGAVPVTKALESYSQQMRIIEFFHGFCRQMNKTIVKSEGS